MKASRAMVAFLCGRVEGVLWTRWFVFRAWLLVLALVCCGVYVLLHVSCRRVACTQVHALLTGVLQVCFGSGIRVPYCTGCWQKEGVLKGRLVPC